MRMKRFLTLLLISLLAMAPLSAEEENTPAAAVCDNKYDACMDKCPDAPEGADKCYQACDAEYEACLVKHEH